MSYWWQDLILKKKIEGKTIVKFVGEGCQAVSKFEWVGKVIGFEKGKIYNGEYKNCEYVIIQIVKHDLSYTDSRDITEKEIYKYPLVNTDIQNVDGIWILFT